MSRITRSVLQPRFYFCCFSLFPQANLLQPLWSIAAFKDILVDVSSELLGGDLHTQTEKHKSQYIQGGGWAGGGCVGIPLIPYLIWIPRKKSEMVFAAFLFRLWFFFSLRFSFIFRSCCFQFRFTSLTDVFTFELNTWVMPLSSEVVFLPACLHRHCLDLLPDGAGL